MANNIFLIPFLVSFSIAAILLTGLVKLFQYKSFSNERRSSRHIHEAKISRFGGVAIILSFVLTLLWDRNLVISPQLLGVFMASGAILIMGIVDDIWQLSWGKQLFFQLGVVLFVFLIGIRLEYITNPFGGVFLFQNGIGFVVNILIVTSWILLIVNAMNWVDGIDGVSGGITTIGLLAIFFVSLRPEVNQPPVAIITAALLGGIIAFVFFNFNPAKILAGTSGSFFMGFILAILALFAGAKIATTLLVLAIPIIDALWVIGERLRAHKSVFDADKRHLHYRLLELGWSQKRICIFYWGITALIATLALVAGAMEKIVLFLIVLIAMVFFSMIMHKKVNILNK